MSTRALGASLIAALCLAGPPSASAADLSGDPYDDPRYAEIYQDAPPPRSERYVQRYEERTVERERYGRDDHGDRGDNGNHDDHGDRGDDGDHSRFADDRYNGGGRGDRYGNGRCVPRHLIRRELQSDGWCDFERLEIRNDYIVIQASRPSGRRFDLKIDRCTGDIVRARPLEGPYYNRYAYNPRRHLRY